jgi:Fur family transcriptional regulator, ferric uptake regulator
MHINFEDIFKEIGIRSTEQRKLIIDTLMNATNHPTVEDLHKRLADMDSSISLSTVYRTVSLLESYGFIEKLDFQDGKFRYEWKKDDQDHHHHLIDLESGKILEFYDAELEELKNKIANKLGYTLVGHRLELYGVPRKKVL